jgi:hypothetical protein
MNGGTLFTLTSAHFNDSYMSILLPNMQEQSGPISTPTSLSKGSADDYCIIKEAKTSG